MITNILNWITIRSIQL